MKIEKYQSLGNDFIIIKGEYENESELAKRLCDRHFSFGGDGLIVISDDNEKAFFFNNDGTSSKLCGNALRCIKRYFIKHNINKNSINLGGNIYNFDIDDNQIKVTFPLCINSHIDIKKIDENTTFIIVDISNKHAILFKDVDDIDIYKKIADENEININFVKVISRNLIEVRTIERGAGLTLSCSSGALATFIFLRTLSLVDDEIIVKFPKGEIKIYYDGNYHMIGDSSFVFEVEISYE